MFDTNGGQMMAESQEELHLAEANRRLDHYNRILKAIRNVNQLIISEEDPLLLIQKACVNLTDTMGYHNAWIALLGGEKALELGLSGEGPVVATAAAGFNGGFEALRRRLHLGEFPKCMIRTLENGNVSVVDSPEDDCPECPLSVEYDGRAGLACMLEHDGVTWGILTASVPAVYAGDAEAQNLFHEVADDLAFALCKIASARDLADSRRYMDFVIEGSGAGTWEWNLVSNETRFNRLWAAMLGYTLEELTPCDYTTWERLVHPGDLEKALGALTDCVEGRTPDYKFEYRMRHKDGGWVWVLDRGQVMTRDESGKALFMFGTHTEITDLKQRQETLVEKEKRLHLAMESASEGVWEWDFSNGLVSFDEVALGMLGYEADFPPKPGEWWIALIHAEDRSFVEKAFAAFVKGETESYSVEFRITTRSGGNIWVASTARIVRMDEQGKPLLIVGIHRDITERRQADARLRESELELRAANQQLKAANQKLQATEQELLASNQKLRKSEERYRAFYENAPIMLGVLDSEGRYLEVNETSYALLGYTREDLLGKTSFDFIHQDDLDALLNDFSELTTKGTAEAVYRFRNSNGRYSTLSSRAAAIPGTEHFLIYSLDITKRREGEEALRESEQRLRAVFNAVDGVPIQGYDRDRCVIFWNPASEKLYGYTCDEVMGRPLEELIIPEESRQAVVAGIRRWHDKDVPIPAGEIELCHKSGRRLQVYSNHVMITNHNGDREMFCVDVDLTMRKQAEKNLRESESRFRGIFENSPSGIALVGLDHRLQSSNQAYRDLLGRDESEVQFLSLKDFTHPDDLEENLRLQSRLGRGEIDKYTMEKRFIQKGGEIRWGYLTACLIRDPKGEPFGFLGHVVDITEQKQAEARLQQVARLESVGRLAGGVAHDFNNMLMGIMGYADMCRSGLPAEHEVRPWIDEITLAAERSADLTRQLLAFARKQTIAPRELDLNQAVEGMLKMLRRLIGEGIDLLWLPGESLRHVCMDPGQIDQILANLCVNARDAIDGVGKVTIETGTTTVNADYCASHSGAREGEYVVLTVSDDGCGMDRDTLEHVFEPFFTTKKDGAGTGLGLATVYGIVNQNQGFLNVYSEPDGGTVFRIYLPCSEGVEKFEVTATVASVPRGGTETILLAEDEKSVREILELFLKDLGYRVLSAGSPEAALGLVKEHGADIDLLITDVVMPGMNGRELAAALQPEFPAMHVLYMSGYTANVIAHHGILEEGVEFLPKPISRDALLRKVREMLDGD